MMQNQFYASEKVSIILPTYARNHNGYLAAAIQSALNQSYPHFELIVVDDHSIDGSADTIAQFAKTDSRIIHLRLPENIGLPALSSAQAFMRSQGEYIAWLFDDCEWKPNHLELLVAKMKENPGYGLVYGKCIVRVAGIEHILGAPGTYAQLAQGGNFIANVATLIPRIVFDELGWLDPSIVLKRNCDLDMWRRIAQKYPLGFVDEIVAIEKGMTLSDSLGQSVSLNIELALQFMNCSRNEYLKISNYSRWDPYRIEKDTTREQKKEILNLAMEHILRSKRYGDIKKLGHLTEGLFVRERTEEISPDLREDYLNLLIWLITYEQDKIKKEKNKQLEKNLLLKAKINGLPFGTNLFLLKWIKRFVPKK